MVVGLERVGASRGELMTRGVGEHNVFNVKHIYFLLGRRCCILVEQIPMSKERFLRLREEERFPRCDDLLVNVYVAHVKRVRSIGRT